MLHARVTMKVYKPVYAWCCFPPDIIDIECSGIVTAVCQAIPALPNPCGGKFC